jgi:hypothetical protein
MPARARRLTRSGGTATIAAATAAVGALLLAACGGSSSSPSRTPTVTSSAQTSPTPSATPQIVGTTRTVLSPLGLRVHSVPVLASANVVGGFSQGRTFTVLAYQSGGGGWFHVQGRTLTGWVVADPALTTAGTFNTYAESDGVTALYPQTWGFQQESFGTLFVPQTGATASVVLETASGLKAFGPAGLAGYAQTSSSPLVVCGYTGTLSYYTRQTSSTGPTPVPLPVPRLPLYAEVRVTINATHAMLMGFNYENGSQLDVFSALYNSVSFPYPLCQAPAAATPTPAP